MIYGIDIGGTKIEIGIFNRELEKIDSWRVPTPVNDYHAFLATLRLLVLQADERLNIKGTVGIGMPGLIDNKGRCISANVYCANGKTIADDLRQNLGRPIAIANDTRCFALSEASGGAGEGFQRVFGAVIGTGAAGGLCINGELYKSANGIAGEYGHHPISAHLQQKYKLPILSCGCGLVGCLEKYISGPGLATIHGFFSRTNSSTFDFIIKLREKDDQAVKAFTCYMDILGSSFSSLIMDYDPDAIIVGGGVSEIDEVMESLPSAIAPHIFRGINLPVIARAKFGNSSGVRGAAILGSLL